MSLKRIQRELDEIKKAPICGCSVELVEGDLFRWAATVQGPANSPYEGGVFRIEIKFALDYPLKPPVACLNTRIFHCNVHFRDVLQVGMLHEWSPVHTVAKVLARFYSLLLAPDPASAFAGMDDIFANNKELYERKAREWTLAYAVPSASLPLEGQDAVHVEDFQPTQPPVGPALSLGIVFALPEDLSGSLLNNWLEIQDVTKLDSALCNRDLRAKFLLFAYEQGPVYNTSPLCQRRLEDASPTGCERARITWMVGMHVWAGLRGASLNTVMLGNGCDRSVLAPYLTKSGKTVTSVIAWEMPDDVTLLDLICQSCGNVTEVVWCCKTLDVQHATLIGQTWPKLNTLHLAHAVQDTTVEALMQTCQDLTSVYLGGWDGKYNFRPTVGHKTLLGTLEAHCHNLKKLTVCNAPLNGYYPQPQPMQLAQCCPHLTEINLHDTSESFHHLVSVGPNLQKLCISYQSFSIYNDTEFVGLMQSCTALRSFTLIKAHLSSERVALIVGQHCPLLEELCLDQYDKLTDVGLQAISTGCTRLRRLDLSGSGVSDQGMRELLHACTHLTHLTANHCPRITDRTLYALAHMAPQITHVSLGCAQWTGWNGMRAFGMSCKLLRVVNIPVERTEAVWFLFRAGVILNGHAVPPLWDYLSR